MGANRELNWKHPRAFCSTEGGRGVCAEEGRLSVAMFRPATIKEIECLLSTQGKDTASLKETCQADLAVIDDEVGSGSPPAPAAPARHGLPFARLKRGPVRARRPDPLGAAVPLKPARRHDAARPRDTPGADPVCPGRPGPPAPAKACRPALGTAVLG